MTRNVVTTQLVADQPVVVVLHHEQSSLVSFKQYFAKEKIAVEYYSISELLQSPSIQQRLSEAYKIAWITGPEDYVLAEADIAATDQLLSDHQHKVTLFFAVTSTFVEQVPGELPYAQQYFDAQQKAILFHNSYLPSATFLFGQDIASEQVATSFLFLLSQGLVQGIVYAPQINFHPQSLESYIQRAIRYFLQPQRASILVRGNSAKGSAISSEIKQLYQSYHFSMVDIQEVMAHTDQTIPFSVVENFVTDDVSDLVSKFTKSLPTPSNFSSNTVWKQMFGSLHEKVDYGTEVEPTPVPTSVQVETDSVDSLEQVPQSVPEPDQATESTPSSEFEYTSQPPLAEKSAERSNPSDDVVTATSPAATTALSATDEPEISAPLESEPEGYQAATRLENKMVASKDQENFDLNQEIQNIFSTTRVSNKKTQVKRIEEKKKVITTKTKKRTAFFYGGLAFTGMGLGIVCLAIIFSFSVNVFRNAMTKYLIQQVQASENIAHESQLAGIDRLKKIVNIQTETYSLLLSLPALDDAKNLVELSENLSAVKQNTEEANKLTEMLYLQSMGMDSGDVVSTAQNMNNKALTAYESLSLFYEKLSAFVGTVTSADVDSSLETYQKELALQKTAIQSMQQLTPLLADLLGVNQKRTYAFIFQNNQELRPTGGFIEDVALITFENGSLISSTILSSYEVDAKMLGTVVPPEGIKKYLNEEGWNFVDGNWNPHFPETATQISWFLEKSLGTTVDGVITIDLDGMARVLEATGPLDLPQYNEVLTHKNIFDRFEFHSEISLVDSKDDYRKQVFQAFVNRITTLPQEKVVPFFGALQQNVADQHMLVSFVAADELNTVKTLGWSGSLLQPNCPSQLSSANCVVDTAAQVEANVGINKANYYLKRSIDHSVALEATQAAHSRTISFQNTAQSESWPKGPYKTFIRLYVPSSAVLGSVLVDGKSIPAIDVSTTVEQNRAVIGFYVEVPIKQTRNVQVNYVVPYSASNSGFSYTFFEQQQPGSGPTPFTLRVTSYSGLRPSVIAPQASFENGVITFSKETIGHGFFGVKYN